MAIKEVIGRYYQLYLFELRFTAGLTPFRVGPLHQFLLQVPANYFDQPSLFGQRQGLRRVVLYFLGISNRIFDLHFARESANNRMEWKNNPRDEGPSSYHLNLFLSLVFAFQCDGSSQSKLQQNYNLTYLIKKTNWQ